MVRPYQNLLTFLDIFMMDPELEKELQRTFTYHFFFHHGLFDEIQHLKDFINEIDDLLDKMLMVKSEREEGVEHLHPTFNAKNQFGNAFPSILWRTTFLQGYFILESALDQICRNIQETKGYTLTLGDMKGNGTQRAALYFRKVCLVTRPFETSTWLNLSGLGKIRNLLVHTGGEIQETNKEIVTIVSKYKGLKVPSFDRWGTSFLILDREFSIFAINLIDTFFQDVYYAINLTK